MVKPCPVTVGLEPSHTSIVWGCPGVPRSVPRIKTTLLIRSITGEPFCLRTVGIELRSVQKISIPSTIGTSDAVQEYKLYEDPFIFNSSFGNFSSAGLLGLDLPILIHLPKDITSSGYNSNWNAYTVHNLIVRVAVGESAQTETNFMELFPVPIKLYDSLPIYRQFLESISESTASNDQQLIVDYNLKESCIGPDDKVNLKIRIMKNSLNYKVSNKLRLKSFNLQVKEVVECHEGGLPPYKDIKLIEDFKECKDHNLNNDITFDYNFKLPLNHDFLSIFEAAENNLEKYKYFDGPGADTVPLTVNNNINHKQNHIKSIEGVPITHYQNFTLLGKLFSIRYEIVLKLKLIHGKDFTVRIPIILSPYNRVSSQYLLSWIMDQCKLSSEIFGKQLIDQLVHTYNLKDSNRLLASYNEPIRVYRNTQSDWVKLGFTMDSFGGPKPLGYID